jgi:hypothetical protein
MERLPHAFRARNHLDVRRIATLKTASGQAARSLS